MLGRKLPNGSGARPDVAIGWPRIANRLNTVGVLSAKVIMVDFLTLLQRSLRIKPFQ